MVKAETPSSNSYSHSGSAGPSSKRKVHHESDQAQGGKKKARTRVSYSCGECHRRKQKCVARKVPELCKAYTPGKSEQDVNARLSRLEHIVDVTLPEILGRPLSNPSSPGIVTSYNSRFGESRSISPDDIGSQGEDNDEGNGTFDRGGKWFGKSVSGSVAPNSVLEQLNSVGTTANGTHDRQSRFRGGSNKGDSETKNELAETENPLAQNGEPSAAELLQSLIKDCGMSENNMRELIQELPPKIETDELIDHYFQNMNWTRYPISEDSFRASYAALFQEGGGSTPRDIRFVPLLFVVLAISVRLSAEHIGGNAHDRKLKSTRFYWFSRRALLIASAIQPDSLEMVLTRLLSARYLTFDRRITECWSQLGAAVCTAQALGLHRDPAGMRLEPAQIEYRRRIWAYLYHADRSYSMVLGRPYAIQDEYTTTLPPNNVQDLSKFTANTPTLPLSTPTRMTFVILRHQLAYLIGKMVHFFQRVRIQNHYSDVLALDNDLQTFIDTLPKHFSFTPDTSLDNVEGYSFIPLHRYLLTTEILFVRISLHRPFILRRLNSDRYAQSRRACFIAANMDFEVRQAYRRAQTKEILRMVGNAYREFQTAMISGILLVLDPLGKDAEKMHVILDSFLKDHEDGEGFLGEEMEETTRREVKIIELLKEKAVQARQNGFRRIVDGVAQEPLTDAQVNANLLLNLQQSRNGQSHSRSTSEAALPAAIRGTYPAVGGKLPLPNSAPPFFGTDFTIGPGIAGSGLPHSPTFHRVQAQVTSSSARNSPAASGSPAADEEMMAQNMLDNWFNAATNPSPMLAEPPLNGAYNVSLTSGQWGTFPTSSGSNITDWMAAPYNLNDVNFGVGTESSDYNYWDSLVNTVNNIRSGPMS